MEPGDEVTVEFTDRPDPTPPEEPETPEAVSMAVAHTALTDGVGETEVPLFADSTELPKESYGADEICWYGVNQPNNTGAQPGNGGNAAVYFGHLVDAGILGNRLEAQWDNIEIDPASPSWSIFNGYLTAIRNAGGTAIVETSYTPMHRTGQRYRNCPPLVFNNTPEEGSFVDDEIALTGKPVWLTQSSYERRGFAVVDSAATPTSVTEEGLAFRYTTPEQNNYTRTAAQGFSDMYVAETAHWPIDITSLVVEVETSAGSGTYEEWTRVADIQDGTSGQKCYVADFTGRIGFKDGRMSSVCAAPATGAKVRASYDYYAAYNYGTEYTLDAIAGVLERVAASTFTVPVPSEDFAGPTIDANLAWTNEPAGWTANGTLNVSYTGSGKMWLLQAPSEATGDFELRVRVSSVTQPGTAATGIIAYQDSNNYVSWRIANTGYLRYITKIGGSVTIGNICSGSTAPITLHMSKSGTTWHLWASDPTPGYEASGYSFTWDWEPTSLGLEIEAGAGVTVSAQFDAMDVITASGLADDVDIYSICADTDAMEAWGAALATQCSGKAKYFSYGNEVTNGAGWTWDGTLALYAECLKAFRTGVKSVIADAQVGFAGFADAQFSQMTTLLASLDGADYDFAEGHFYKFDEGAIAAWKSARPDDFISRLAAAGDSAKPIFDGEMSAPCGVLATSDAKGHANGPREKRQVEETIQMLMYQRAKGFLGVALWPGTDLEAKGVNEGNKWGGKDGLFYTTAGDAIPNGIKPVYYAVRNLAQCKGILVDLGAVETVGSVVLSCSDRSQIESVRVLGSLTCTDATSAPSKVTAALTGGTGVFVVDVIDGDGALVTETWTATANAGNSTFAVAGSVSGAQGTATKEVAFESTNGVCAFTIPAGTYTEGQVFEWETFAGDGFAEIGTASGGTGAGDITIDLGDESARYLLIELTRAEGASHIGLKQVTVLDDADANISDGCLYSLEGWQDEYVPS